MFAKKKEGGSEFKQSIEQNVLYRYTTPFRKVYRNQAKQLFLVFFAVSLGKT